MPLKMRTPEMLERIREVIRRVYPTEGAVGVMENVPDEPPGYRQLRRKTIYDMAKRMGVRMDDAHLALARKKRMKSEYAEQRQAQKNADGVVPFAKKPDSAPGGRFFWGK